jgi:hypothetical protein
MVEATGLEIMASMSPSMTSSAYQISWKSTDRFKVTRKATQRNKSYKTDLIFEQMKVG